MADTEKAREALVNLECRALEDDPKFREAEVSENVSELTKALDLLDALLVKQASGTFFEECYLHWPTLDEAAIRLTRDGDHKLKGLDIAERGTIADMRKQATAVAGAWALDRAHQYKPHSCCFEAVRQIAEGLEGGEHIKAAAHGELDDIIERRKHDRDGS